MDRRLWVIALAGIPLLCPIALAGPGEGSFIVDGQLSLPERSTVDGTPLALFAEGTENLRAIRLDAPNAHFYLVEQERTVVQPTPEAFWVYKADPTHREWNLTDVTIEMVDAPASFGWAGVYPQEATLQFRAHDRFALVPSEFSSLGDRDETTGVLTGLLEEGNRPDEGFYHQPVASDHFFLEAPGEATLTGSGSIKLFGGEFRIESAEWDAQVQTGQIPSEDGALRKEVSRWLYVEFEDARVQVANDDATQVALEAAAAEWSGLSRFTPRRGQLSTEDGSYVATGTLTSLSGDFSALLAPRREANELLASMILEGDLDSTSLKAQSTRVLPAPSGGSFPWPWMLLFGAVVVSGSAGIAVVVSRQRRPARAAGHDALPWGASAVVPAVADDGLRADDCIRFADEAAVERRWARALHWARRAAELAPRNARVRADEGEYLFQLGLFEEALQAFSVASALETSEGYADYRGAQAAAAAGRPVDEVLSWLSRALSRSPDLVGDLELFKEFDNLRGLPEYDAIVREAYVRLGIDPAPDF